MSKYGQALGIWELRVGGGDIDLRPKMGDNRKFRRILMDDRYKKDQALRFEAFEEFMFNMIKRDNPDDNDEEIKCYVEENCLQLFEEAMVKFKFTTQSELDRNRKEALGELKKEIGGV